MRIENLIPLGVIPGPNTPNALDSFLIPFINECIELARGVRTYDAQAGESFDLHAYLLTAFGDLPAMSKLLCLKGVNGFSPCRFCLIHGERNLGASRVSRNYYVALRGPIRVDNSVASGWDPRNLPKRTLENFYEQLHEIEACSTVTQRNDLKMLYGINGKSTLLQIPSIIFPLSFPHDIMHLFFENICPMLVAHWTGTGRYKDQEPADPGYRLAPHIWEQIGIETAAAYHTIPSDFVGAMPDICKSKYKAEYWSFWTIHLAPILLQRRFPNDKYYRHFCLLVDIIKLCLQFTITDREIYELQQLIIEWVETYER